MAYAGKIQPMGWSRVVQLETLKLDCISIRFGNPYLVSDALSCKVETRHDLLQKLQMSKKGTGDEHMRQKGTSSFQGLFMLPVGLTEVIRPPGIQKLRGSFMA